MLGGRLAVLSEPSSQPNDTKRDPTTFRHPAPSARLLVEGGALKTGAPHAAAAEIQTRLAKRHPGDLHPVEIRRILSRHHLSRPQQDEILKGLYSHALACFLDDDRLTDEETEYLFELRRLFDLNARRTLRELAEHLGIEIALDDARLANLYRCALMWHMESGDLPVVTDVAVRLQANEICHLEAPATWLEWQDTKPRRRPSRPVSRIRITRGEYYRVGSFAPNVARGENMGDVDRGTGDPAA